jgi:hypothetical protein
MWQPIEAAPVGEEVLLWGPYLERPAIGVRYGANERYWTAMVDGRAAIENQSDFGTTHMTVDYPTHWMRVPRPPKKGSIDPR